MDDYEFNILEDMTNIYNKRAREIAAQHYGLSDNLDATKIMEEERYCWGIVEEEEMCFQMKG